MTTFRPDTSFPFFAIARAFDVPYADVLKIADWFEGSSKGYASVQLREGLLTAVQDAICAERERRRQVNKDAELAKVKP